MTYHALFQKIDECECGERLSTKQRVCPRCKSANLDYRPKHQIGSAIKMVKEDELELKQEEDFNMAGPLVEIR